MLCKSALLIIATLAIASQPVSAASRFYCAADDSQIKLSVNGGFDDGNGAKLTHFRGLMLLKDPKVPESLRKMELDSAMLSQDWADADDLRLRMYTETPGESPFASLDMIIETAMSVKDGGRFQGRYALVINTADRRRDGPRTAVVKVSEKISCTYE
ncbi:MAG: hypothetical protein ACOH2J_04590 [Allorhizobium sp.]